MPSRYGYNHAMSWAGSVLHPCGGYSVSIWEVLCFHVVTPMQLHLRGEMLCVHVKSDLTLRWGVALHSLGKLLCIHVKGDSTLVWGVALHPCEG